MKQFFFFLTTLAFSISYSCTKQDNNTIALQDLSGSLLLSGSSVRLVPANKGADETILREGIFVDATYTLVDVTADRKKVLFSKKNELVLSNWNGEILNHIFLPDNQLFKHIKISPDGQKIATVSNDINVSVFDLNTGAMDRSFIPAGLLFAPIESVDGLCWSPEGSRLALLERYVWGIFTSHDTQTLYVVTVDSTGNNITTVFSAPGCSSGSLFGCETSWNWESVAWSPDGASLAWYSSRGAGEIWKAKADYENSGQLVFEETGPVSDLHWSPDNRYLVFMAAGDVHIADQTDYKRLLFETRARPVFWFE